VHLKKVTFFQERYPTREHYPFNLEVFCQTQRVVFNSPVTFFVGENGTGKSTLLEALSRKCRIHIWRNAEGAVMKKIPMRGSSAILLVWNGPTASCRAHFFPANGSATSPDKHPGERRTLFQDFRHNFRGPAGGIPNDRLATVGV